MFIDKDGIERNAEKGEEIIGFTFNQLIPETKNIDGTYDCSCKCGGSKLNVKRSDLLKNRANSCKECKFEQRKTKVDFIGRTSGTLRVTKELASELRKDNRMKRYVEAVCDVELGGCGRIKRYEPYNLVPGNTVSCGECSVHRDRVASINKTHGMSNHKLFGRYHHMVSRITDENAKRFHRYGGRGIDIDPRYLGEMGFIEYVTDIVNKFPDWEQYIDQGCHIDREDNERGYWTDNMRIVTPKVNANNKHSDYHVFVSYYGKKVTLSEACVLAGAAYSTVSSRLEDGWDLERALFTIARRGVRNKDFDKPMTKKIFLLNR